MRSKPKKPNWGLVAAALISLSVIWLVFGTALLLGFQYWVNNNAPVADENTTAQEEYEDDADVSEEDPADEDDFDDPDDEEGTDITEDTDDDDLDDDVDDTDDEDVDDDDLDDDEDDDDEDDDDDGSKTFTVDAWDGFAAVRSGRGTNYSQVGKLNNGETVKVTDLENGWYKIASGKWKGYYLHQSSLRQ